MNWTANIVNDPNQNYDLVVEICEGHQHRATIRRPPSGTLTLCVYTEDGDFDVPARWLIDVLQRADRDLVASASEE